MASSCTGYSFFHYRLQPRDVEEPEEFWDRPVAVVGAVGTEDGERVKRKGGAFSGQMPHGFGCFFAETTFGGFKGYFFFVIGVVAQVGEGCNKLGNYASSGSALMEDEGAFLFVR